MNLELFPDVLCKNLITKKFDPKVIKESLRVETDLEDDQAEFITVEVCRFIIQVSGKIKIMTSPMIREIVNVMLLKYGFEKERLQYTRIGLPFYDISKLPFSYNITTHVFKEYHNVENLIKKLEAELKNGKN